MANREVIEEEERDCTSPAAAASAAIGLLLVLGFLLLYGISDSAGRRDMGSQPSATHEALPLEK